MADTSTRDPATRRDRRPRAAQGDKAPRSGDYPVRIENGKDYMLHGIPMHVFTAAKERAEAGGHSFRWAALRLLERFAKGQVDL